jgi:hypothetical protein
MLLAKSLFENLCVTNFKNVDHAPKLWFVIFDGTICVWEGVTKWYKGERGVLPKCQVTFFFKIVFAFGLFSKIISIVLEKLKCHVKTGGWGEE